MEPNKTNRNPRESSRTSNTNPTPATPTPLIPIAPTLNQDYLNAFYRNYSSLIYSQLYNYNQNNTTALPINNHVRDNQQASLANNALPISNVHNNQQASFSTSNNGDMHTFPPMQVGNNADIPSSHQRMSNNQQHSQFSSYMQSRQRDQQQNLQNNQNANNDGLAQRVKTNSSSFNPIQTGNTSKNDYNLYSGSLNQPRQQTSSQKISQFYQHPLDLSQNNYINESTHFSPSQSQSVPQPKNISSNSRNVSSSLPIGSTSELNNMPSEISALSMIPSESRKRMDNSSTRTFTNTPNQTDNSQTINPQEQHPFIYHSNYHHLYNQQYFQMQQQAMLIKQFENMQRLGLGSNVSLPSMFQFSNMAPQNLNSPVSMNPYALLNAQTNLFPGVVNQTFESLMANASPQEPTVKRRRATTRQRKTTTTANTKTKTDMATKSNPLTSTTISNDNDSPRTSTSETSEQSGPSRPLSNLAAATKARQSPEIIRNTRTTSQQDDSKSLSKQLKSVNILDCHSNKNLIADQVQAKEIGSKTNNSSREVVAMNGTETDAPESLSGSENVMSAGITSRNDNELTGVSKESNAKDQNSSQKRKLNTQDDDETTKKFRASQSETSENSERQITSNKTDHVKIKAANHPEKNNQNDKDASMTKASGKQSVNRCVSQLHNDISHGKKSLHSAKEPEYEKRNQSMSATDILNPTHPFIDQTSYLIMQKKNLSCNAVQTLLSSHVESDNRINYEKKQNNESENNTNRIIYDESNSQSGIAHPHTIVLSSEPTHTQLPTSTNLSSKKGKAVHESKSLNFTHELNSFNNHPASKIPDLEISNANATPTSQPSIVSAKSLERSIDMAQNNGISAADHFGSLKIKQTIKEVKNMEADNLTCYESKTTAETTEDKKGIPPSTNQTANTFSNIDTRLQSNDTVEDTHVHVVPHTINLINTQIEHLASGGKLEENYDSRSLPSFESKSGTSITTKQYGAELKSQSSKTMQSNDVKVKIASADSSSAQSMTLTENIKKILIQDQDKHIKESSSELINSNELNQLQCLSARNCASALKHNVVNDLSMNCSFAESDSYFYRNVGSVIKDSLDVLSMRNYNTQIPDNDQIQTSCTNQDNAAFLQQMQQKYCGTSYQRDETETKLLMSEKSNSITQRNFSQHEYDNGLTNDIAHNCIKTEVESNTLNQMDDRTVPTYNPLDYFNSEKGENISSAIQRNNDTVNPFHYSNDNRTAIKLENVHVTENYSPNSLQNPYSWPKYNEFEYNAHQASSEYLKQIKGSENEQLTLDPENRSINHKQNLENDIRKDLTDMDARSGEENHNHQTFSFLNASNEGNEQVVPQNTHLQLTQFETGKNTDLNTFVYDQEIDEYFDRQSKLLIDLNTTVPSAAQPKNKNEQKFNTMDQGKNVGLSVKAVNVFDYTNFDQKQEHFSSTECAADVGEKHFDVPKANENENENSGNCFGLLNENMTVDNHSKERIIPNSSKDAMAVNMSNENTPDNILESLQDGSNIVNETEDATTKNQIKMKQILTDPLPNNNSSIKATDNTKAVLQNEEDKTVNTTEHATISINGYINIIENYTRPKLNLHNESDISDKTRGSLQNELSITMKAKDQELVNLHLVLNESSNNQTENTDDNNKSTGNNLKEPLRGNEYINTESLLQDPQSTKFQQKEVYMMADLISDLNNSYKAGSDIGTNVMNIESTQNKLPRKKFRRSNSNYEMKSNITTDNMSNEKNKNSLHIPDPRQAPKRRFRRHNSNQEAGMHTKSNLESYYVTNRSDNRNKPNQSNLNLEVKSNKNMPPLSRGKQILMRSQKLTKRNTDSSAVSGKTGFKIKLLPENSEKINTLSHEEIMKIDLRKQKFESFEKIQRQSKLSGSQNCYDSKIHLYSIIKVEDFEKSYKPTLKQLPSDKTSEQYRLLIEGKGFENLENTIQSLNLNYGDAKNNSELKITKPDAKEKVCEICKHIFMRPVWEHIKTKRHEVSVHTEKFYESLDQVIADINKQCLLPMSDAEYLHNSVNKRKNALIYLKQNLFQEISVHTKRVDNNTSCEDRTNAIYVEDKQNLHEKCLGDVYNQGSNRITKYNKVTKKSDEKNENDEYRSEIPPTKKRKIEEINDTINKQSDFTQKECEITDEKSKTNQDTNTYWKTQNISTKNIQGSDYSELLIHKPKLNFLSQEYTSAERTRINQVMEPFQPAIQMFSDNSIDDLEQQTALITLKEEKIYIENKTKEKRKKMETKVKSKVTIKNLLQVVYPEQNFDNLDFHENDYNCSNKNYRISKLKNLYSKQIKNPDVFIIPETISKKSTIDHQQNLFTVNEEFSNKIPFDASESEESVERGFIIRPGYGLNTFQQVPEYHKHSLNSNSNSNSPVFGTLPETSNLNKSYRALEAARMEKIVELSSSNRNRCSPTIPQTLP